MHVSWRVRLVALLLLAGCTSSVACHAGTCSSGVYLDLRPMDLPRDTYPVSATLCVDGECESRRLSSFGESFLAITGELPRSPATVKVTVEVLAADGSVLTLTPTPVSAIIDATQGEACGPICNVVSLRYEASSRSLIQLGV